MRQFSESVATNLARKQGLEVVMFIGVEWTDGGEVYYSSTDFPGTNKSLVSVSGLETTHQIDGSGSSQSVTVTLSDTDGALTNILDTVDIHKRPAKVYLGFPDTPIDQSVVLLDGEINSEMVWDDRARTLTITIMSKIEGRLFGFAAEDGLFVDVDSKTRTDPWPFRFGLTCAYPAVQVRNGRTGTLREGQGVLDPTIDAKICAAQKINCPLIEDPLSTPNEPTAAENLDKARRDMIEAVTGAIENEEEGPGPDYQFGTELTQPNGNPHGTSGTGRNLIPDRECERNKFEALCQLYRDRANQLVYVKDEIEVLGGDKFPQNQTIDIRIDSIIYTGQFSGETFTIDKVNQVNAPTGNVNCKDVEPLARDYVKPNDSAPGSLAACQQPTNRLELRVVGGAGQAWRQLGEIEDGRFTWLPSGSTVHLESTQTRVHVVSLVPGTVDGVFAYRTFGDTRQLTELPADYYEIVETDYGDLTAVEVHLPRSLESYTDERWEDTLYVQFDSDVGPNPVDVIEWIAERYTDFDIDATNFAAVKSKLSNYPCNYYHAAKDNVIATLSKIAYEARCALIVTDNIIKLRYLSEEPDADKTLTNADVVAGSFRYFHTRSEDLITSSEVTWQPWGASLVDVDKVERKFTVERNVNKYGLTSQSRTYDTITDEDQALKTATFWSIRDANTWRNVEFSTTLEHMDLELFDCVQLNIDQFPNVKCIVRSSSVDPDQGTVKLECWTPVLSGTTGAYEWAWPSSQNGGRPYPTHNFDVPKPKIKVTPPAGHPLYIEDPNPPVAPSTGDRFPSDADDSFPVTVCQDINETQLVDTVEPSFSRIDFPTARQADRADELGSGGGGGGGGKPDKKEKACGRITSEGCIWKVTVQYVTCTGANGGHPNGAGECQVLGGCSSTEKGAICSSTGNFFRCKTFSSKNMAAAYAGTVRAQIQREKCEWRAGKQGPITVTGPTGVRTKDCFGQDGGTETGSGE